MSINLGSIANSINNAIKPISPIKIDTNAITTTLGNIVDSQFTNLPPSLTSTLVDIANNGVKNVLVSQFDKLTSPLSSALNQAGVQLGNFSSILGQNTASSIASNGFGSSFNAKPNVLNDYVNYTYHIRFSMTSEQQAYNNINQNNPNSNSLTKTVIAESGVTAGFNISSLQTSALGTADNRKRNMWTTTAYTMVIKEPLGITLLDKMYSASVELGVLNHFRCPYFLEIWFNGYDEAGNLLADNLFYNINRVLILDMDATSTNVGTEYTFRMINDGTWGEMNSISTPPSTLVVDANTLGEFFEVLELKWNNQDTNVNQDGIHRNYYKFVIPEYWKPWKLRNPDTEKQNARNASMRLEISEQTGNTTVSINRGQSVESIVDFVVYLCQEAQKWITGENSPAPGAATLKGQGMVRYVTVFPKVEINTAYALDPVTADYIRKITYYLLPTESVKMYTDMESIKAAENLTTQASKFQYLVSNNRIAKKYEYIYTGKNTEVLKFDFNVASMWQISQPTWVQSNSYDQYTQGAVTDTNSVGYQLVKGLLNRTKLSPTGIISALDSVTNNTVSGVINGVTNLSASLLEAENKIVSQATTQLNNSVAKIANNITSGLNIPSTSADTTSLFNGELTINLNVGDITKSVVANAESQLLNNLQQNITFLTQRQRALTDKYVEDAVPVNNKKAMWPHTGAFDSKPTQQLARQNTDQNKIPAVQDPNSYSIGTGLVGSVINNIYNSVAFQSITFTIKGDPWWLPVGNILQNGLAEQIVGLQYNTNAQTTQDHAVYLGGDNEIVFEFRAGVKIDENTGLAVTTSTDSDFFSGLYMVNTITNNFNNGKFTQELYCLRDSLAANASTSDKSYGPGTVAPGGLPAAPAPSVGPGTVAPGRLPGQSVGPGTVAPGRLPGQSVGPGTVAPGRLPGQSVGPGTVAPGSLPMQVPTDRR